MVIFRGVFGRYAYIARDHFGFEKPIFRLAPFGRSPWKSCRFRSIFGHRGGKVTFFRLDQYFMKQYNYHLQHEHLLNCTPQDKRGARTDNDAAVQSITKLAACMHMRRSPENFSLRSLWQRKGTSDVVLPFGQLCERARGPA